MKKIIILIASIILFLILGFALYAFFRPGQERAGEKQEQTVEFGVGLNEWQAKGKTVTFTTALEFVSQLEKAGAAPRWVKIKGGKPEEVYKFWEFRSFGKEFKIEENKTYQFFGDKPVKLKVVYEQ